MRVVPSAALLACSAHFASTSANQAARCRLPAARAATESNTSAPLNGITAVIVCSILKGATVSPRTSWRRNSTSTGPRGGSTVVQGGLSSRPARPRMMGAWADRPSRLAGAGSTMKNRRGTMVARRSSSWSRRRPAGWPWPVHPSCGGQRRARWTSGPGRRLSRRRGPVEVEFLRQLVLGETVAAFEDAADYG